MLVKESEEVRGEREREKNEHPWRLCLRVRLCVCGRKKNAVTNMFVSMRQRETALSRLPLWVVYKKICHIFLNPHHQPPCSTQPLVTPDWSCSVFALSFFLLVSVSHSVSLSPHMLLWDLGRLQTPGRGDKVGEKETAKRRERMKDGKKGREGKM